MIGAASRPLSGAARLEQRRMLEAAVALLRDKQLDQAEPVLRQLLRRWPGQGDALQFLGILRHGRGFSEEGLALIEQAIVALPGEAGPLNNLGNVLVELQRFDEAVSAYRRCLALQPGWIDALNNLSTIHRRQGEYAESETLCRRALDSDPKFAQAWYNLSLALLEQGRIDEGLDAHSRAIALWPRHLEARNAVPKALVRHGRLDDAARLYREWLATDPHNPVIQHHLAACTGSAVPERASDAYVERTFDAFAATFDANLATLGYRAPSLVAGLLSEMLPAPAKQFDVLDLGCGTGLVGPLVKGWSRRLDGCDLSTGMLEKAARRGDYDTLRHAELVADLRAHPAGYDLLVCADTLCYFGDIAETMQSAYKSLRIGGAFVFTVESWDGDDLPYHLQTHGRYAHRGDYVRRVVAEGGLTLHTLREESLRMEAGRPVGGWLVGAVQTADISTA
jgi:predicted TPR repeat methyltransferase